MPSWLTRAAGVVALAASLLSAAASWRSAAARGPDRVSMVEAELGTLARALPSVDAVGFLEYHADDDSADHLLVYYLAQYALAPRLVLKRTDLEFLIVAPEATRPGDDDRLEGFVPVASTREGYRLYQRRVD